MAMMQTRRRFLTTGALVGASRCLRALPTLAAEEALDTTSVRLSKSTPICGAPVYVAEELLRAEGFTDIRYVETTLAANDAVRHGEIDFISGFAIQQLKALDAGVPMTVLAGLHAGCFEFFAQKNIHGIAELKGKSVGLKLSPPDLLTLMAAQVGLDPAKDINWVTDPSLNPMALFAEGKIDAFLGFPPEPQELRARKAGHVIVSTAADRPWSQISAACCRATGNMSANTRWRPSACCARSSKRRIYLPQTQRVQRVRSSIAVSPRVSTSRCRR
jgi:NitT/TauT family transport system substrate-binding protein